MATVICLGISTASFAQFFGGRPDYWKNNRHSLGFGLGAANFLGELGGRDQVGSDFIYDLNLSETRPALQFLYRYQFASRFFAKAQLAFGYIGGNDALTEEIFRRNRNLHFRSSITELSIQGEFIVWDLTPKGRYNIRSQGAFKPPLHFYVSAGVGVTAFNPKANVDGQWYALRDMGTEGQGLPGGAEKYSLFTVVLPMGAGVRWELNRQWSIGLEIVHRITFTDYMDDVSTVYFDNDLIRDNYGEMAAFLADPSLGYYVDESGREIPLNSTFTGAQRGDPNDNDAYMTGSVTMYYKVAQKRFKKGRGRVTKRRHRHVIF